MGCRLGVHTLAVNSSQELRVLWGCTLRAHTQRMFGVHALAASLGCSGGAVLGCMFGVHSWGVLSVRELRVLWGCSLGVHALAVSLGCAWRGGGVSGAPLLRGPYPHTAVSPRKVVCFRKWLLHVAVVTGANAPALGRAKASREGRPRGAGVELGGPPQWEGLWCDIPPPAQGCSTTGTCVTVPCGRDSSKGCRCREMSWGLFYVIFFSP